jgi:hypothetical protein
MRFFRDPAAQTIVGTAGVGAAFLALGALAVASGKGELAIICFVVAALMFGASALAVIWWIREPRPSAPPPPAPARELVDTTPEHLVGLYREHTSVQADSLASPFIGKWIRISGPLNDAQSFKYFVQVTFGDRTLVADKSHVYAYFDHKPWADRLAMLRRGDTVTLIGRIKSVDAGSLHVEHCELE